MPQNNQTLLEKTVADQWQTLPSGLTVLVRPMPGYSSTHVIYATKFGSIDRDFLPERANGASAGRRGAFSGAQNVRRRGR